MLPSFARLRRRRDFSHVVKQRRRVARGAVVVHYARREESTIDSVASARVGLIVSKSVGGAVVRNRVKRRLRAAVKPCLASLPHDLDMVLRAQPACAVMPFADVQADVTAAVQDVLSRANAGR